MARPRCIVFESKEKYVALANNPAQDEWSSNVMAPLLDGDPQWIDGSWLERPGSQTSWELKRAGKIETKS